MTLLEMSLSGGCIILAAGLIRALGRDRLPRTAFEALWALAVLRLTVPVAPPFRFSALTLLRQIVPHTAAGPRPLPAAITPVRTFVQAVDIIQDAPVYDRGTPFPTVTVLWLAGVCALALLFAMSYVRSYRRFRGAEPVNNNYVNHFLADHPLRRTVRVRVSDQVAAPLTYGLFRPVILLPRSMDMGDETALGYVLAHELAHIRRFDALRKFILAAAVCPHWFNPAVWLMLTLANRDMELACDQAVIRAYGPDARQSYARALLDMEERRSGLTGLANGFSGNAIDERIHSIMKIRPRSLLSMALALVLVLGVGAVFATAAPAEDTPAGETVAADGDVAYLRIDPSQDPQAQLTEERTQMEERLARIEEAEAQIARERAMLEERLSQMEYRAMAEHLAAVLTGETSDPAYDAEGYSELCQTLEPYEELNIPLGALPAGSSVYTAVLTDAGSVAVTLQDKDGLDSGGLSTNPDSDPCHFQTISGIQAGTYTLCIWHGGEQAADVAVCYRVG